MKYQYQAKTKEGETQVGYVEAGSRDAALSILTSHGLFILSLTEAEKEHWYDRILSYLGRVKVKDLALFSRQFATMLEAHLPLNFTLKNLQVSNQNLKLAIAQISEDVGAGLSLSQALDRQKNIFPGYYISMVRSAEVVGNLDEVMGFLAEYSEKEYTLVSKTKSALIYPFVVISLFLVVALIMVVYVFPQIGPVFAQAGVQLPFFSQFLISSGDFLAKNWATILTLLIIAAISILDYARTPEGRATLDEIKVRAPLLRSVYQPVTVTRLANVIFMLLKGGVPIVQATEIAGQTINNFAYQDVMDKISEDVRQGRPISQAIADFPDYFPTLVPQMLSVGEASGQTDKMFERLAGFYSRESDEIITKLVEMIQPILMIMIGGLVGLLFASILVPLYQLTSSIR